MIKQDKTVKTFLQEQCLQALDIKDFQKASVTSPLCQRLEKFFQIYQNVYLRYLNQMCVWTIFCLSHTNNTTGKKALIFIHF